MQGPLAHQSVSCDEELKFACHRRAVCGAGPFSVSHPKGTDGSFSYWLQSYEMLMSFQSSVLFFIVLFSAIYFFRRLTAESVPYQNQRRTPKIN